MSPKRRAAYVIIQSFIGVLLFGTWALAGHLSVNEEIGSAVLRVIPYFLAYEAGVLSRFIPGMDTITRKMSQDLR